MKTSATKGSTAAVEARGKRANYKAGHGGTIGGAIKGHIADLGRSAHNYFYDESIEGLTRESNSMGKITASYNTFNDNIESLLEKEQAKGNASVFNGNGFSLTNYSTFDAAAKEVKSARAAFNSGSSVTIGKDASGNWTVDTSRMVSSVTARQLTAADLSDIEGYYVTTRDNARDELMNMAFEGSKGASYQALTAKGQAALKDSLVNAESLQATILENANSSVVQQIMGSTTSGGNGALEKIIDPNKHLDVTDFTNAGTKLKDAAKVAQGEADIKIAEMNKENAAKGDKK